MNKNPKEHLVEQIMTLSRNARADKGKKHNYPSTRKSTEPSKLSVYKSVKNKLISQGVDISLDNNGYYIVTDNEYKPEYGQYENNRMVKYVRKARGHDIEKYRFEAWQELAMKEPHSKVWNDERFKSDLLKWAIHCSGMSKEDIEQYYEKKNMSISQLFTNFYHINESDIFLWTYPLWREYYECTPKDELDEEFKFILGIKPGTVQCHPEWAYVTIQKELDKLEEKENEKDKRSWSAKIGHQNRRLKG